MRNLDQLEVVEYQLDRYAPFKNNSPIIDVILKRVRKELPEKWLIYDSAYLLNKQGEWVTAFKPSEPFYDNCFFDTAEEALRFWEENHCVSRFESIRKTHGMDRSGQPFERADTGIEWFGVEGDAGDDQELGGTLTLRVTLQ
jgi:hypothetical protein